MSWLNFNEGLNSLKGQLTNFAQSVLTEDENGESVLIPNDYEELKNICLQQEQEIARLRKENEDSQNKNIQENESWNWVNNEETSNGILAKTTEEFKKEINRLQNEKKDLIAQLEQLDSDNQQNVGKLMEVKHNLQTELEKTKESFNELKQLHNVCLAKEKSFQEEIGNICSINENDLLKQKEIQDELKTKYEKLLEEFQKISAELTVTKSDLFTNKQEKNSFVEIEELQQQLEKSKQEIKNIQNMNETQLANQKGIENEQRSRHEQLLKQFEEITSELRVTKKDFEEFTNTSNVERKNILKELEQSKESYFELEKNYRAGIENQEQQQEELNNFEKLYEDEIIKLKKSENESASKYQNLLKKYERTTKTLEELEKLKSSKLHSNEESLVITQEKTLKTNCEELTDCDLQDSTSMNNCSVSEAIDGYSILKSLYESFNQNLTNFSKSINSLNSNNNTIELQQIENDLISLEEQNKCFIKENELIHSQYSNSEMFRAQIDNVVLAGLKKYNDTLKEKIAFETSEREKLNLYIVQFTNYVRKLFDDFKHSTICEYQGISIDISELDELQKLFKEIYGFMYELKSKVILLSDSNINIITEKNQEIERLLEKSDQLTQEMLEKSQIIKECENEIAELSKNNDLLITDLEVYKNNHLETISEIDEDKTILLEEQLENANSQIKELQSQLQSIPENKESHLDIFDSKIEEEDNTYLELLNKYDELQVEYDVMKKDYTNIEKEFQTVVQENKSLKLSVDSLKTNSENLIYLQDELKTFNESLQSDTEMYKEKIDNLIQSNNKLKEASEENESLKTECNYMREKLSKEEQIRTNLQGEISELTEKLKLSKMAETSLKLQYDTLSKDYSNSVDTINKLNENFNKVQSLMISYQKECQDLKTKNEEVYMENKKLEEVVRNQEKSIKSTKQSVGELEQKLLNKTQEANSNQESVDTINKLEENFNNVQSLMISYQKECEDLKTKNEELYVENKKFEEIVRNQEESISSTKQLVEELEQKLFNNTQETNLERRNSNGTNSYPLSETTHLETKLHEIETENSELKGQLEALNTSQSELIQLVTTKHQENVAYHSEIQRLNQILNSESQKCRDFEIEINNLKTLLTTENQDKEKILEKLKEENINLKEQCELLSQSLLDEQAKFSRLLEEKSSSSEAELALKKKLERLQTHLIELEEHYTSELYEAEQKNLALQAKVNETEEREKSSSTMYTSVSIRANQQVESLQNQLQAMTSERDSLRKQISDLEDTINKQTAALTNLQLVLEQFRKDKEKEVHKETERLRRQINTEKKTQDNLKNEITALKSQLEESKQGLSAAARLSDQLENSRNSIAALKEEVSRLQTNLALKQEELDSALSQTDGKVDKSLIKNLVIGFVTCNNNLNKDQTQILKIIGTVLDFNQQDHDKLKLNKGLQGSWLGGILSPQSNLQNAGQESLSRAFIEFLEKESKPRVVPSLLNANGDTPKPSSSRSSTPQTPANLSEIVLPTFADFAQNRNSSSILKDVLKDNS